MGEQLLRRKNGGITMLLCLVELRSVTASFRNPEFQNFHKSFTLPPPTSLAGLAGAALGLSPKQAQDFLADNNFYLGVSGKSKGMARDLWKYRQNLSGARSVIQREVYVDNHFWSVYGSENTSAVEQVQAAFQSPVYALTLGSSDSLAKVVQVRLTREVVEGSTIGSTLVEGDIVPLILEQAMLGGSFSLTISESDPVAHQLPMRFKYESDYGVRRVVSRKLFSFVGPSVTFKNRTFRGVWADDVFVPVFPY